MRCPVWLITGLALAGCTTLPHDGPAARDIKSEARRPQASYAIVDLSYNTTQLIASRPPVALASLVGAASTAPNDLIAEGDTLSVSVFEAGAGGLFARPSEIAGSGPPQTFPRLVVDRDGAVVLPFAGSVHVAGLTPGAAADSIRRALRKKAIDPQVTLSVSDSRANSVVVVGEVRAAGHFVLSAHNDRLLDVLASAGGGVRPPADLAVVVVRGAQSAEIPYDVLMREPAENIRLAPQDQVRILYRPRKYSTFGAIGRPAQIGIEDDSLTLAAAISRSGGLDASSANGSSVLLFRFERPDVAAALGVTTPASPKGVPIVYRLNMRETAGFFIANNFTIQSDDLLYVPRAPLAEAKQFLDLVNTVSQTSYNVRVTSVLP